MMLAVTHSHTFQGVKKVLYKKKFYSSSCCWASTIYSLSDISLILLFNSGKVELRWWSAHTFLEELSGISHEIRLANKLVLKFNPHFEDYSSVRKKLQPIIVTPLSAPSGFGFMDSIIF